MTNSITTFLNDESGAVTVDWVVLTAALVGLGLAVMSVVSGGIEDLSTDISTSLTEATPNNGDSFFKDNTERRTSNSSGASESTSDNSGTDPNG